MVTSFKLFTTNCASVFSTVLSQSCKVEVPSINTTLGNLISSTMFLVVSCAYILVIKPINKANISILFFMIFLIYTTKLLLKSILNYDKNHVILNFITSEFKFLK